MVEKDKRAVPRIVAGIWGVPKSGKTHLALTFPDPIAAIEIGETGIEDLLWKFEREGKEIEHIPIFVPNLSMSASDHNRILTEFEKKLKEVVANPKYKTVVIDSMSRLWRSIRVVKTEEAHQISERQKKNQADFELANDYHEQIVMMARTRKDLNVVLVHRHRDVYAQVLNPETGRSQLTATGDVESRDYKGLENIVQLMIRTDARGGKFYQTLELCRFDARLNGRVYEGFGYPQLMEQLFGEEE